MLWSRPKLCLPMMFTPPLLSIPSLRNTFVKICSASTAAGTHTTAFPPSFFCLQTPPSILSCSVLSFITYSPYHFFDPSYGCAYRLLFGTYPATGILVTTLSLLALYLCFSPCSKASLVPFFIIRPFPILFLWYSSPTWLFLFPHFVSHH